MVLTPLVGRQGVRAHLGRQLARLRHGPRCECRKGVRVTQPAREGGAETQTRRRREQAKQAPTGNPGDEVLRIGGFALGFFCSAMTQCSCQAEGRMAFNVLVDGEDALWRWVGSPGLWIGAFLRCMGLGEGAGRSLVRSLVS